MRIQENVQVVKDFFAAVGRDKPVLLALCAEISRGSFRVRTGRWRYASRACGGSRFASEGFLIGNFIIGALKYLAQGDRVLVVGFAKGTVKVTDKTFQDHWVFAITLRDGRLINVREYADPSTGAGLRDGHKPQALNSTMTRSRQDHNKRVDCRVIGGDPAALADAD